MSTHLWHTHAPVTQWRHCVYISSMCVLESSNAQSTRDAHGLEQESRHRVGRRPKRPTPITYGSVNGKLCKFANRTL